MADAKPGKEGRGINLLIIDLSTEGEYRAFTLSLGRPFNRYARIN
jgi:hypothetical protein